MWSLGRQYTPKEQKGKKKGQNVKSRKIQQQQLFEFRALNEVNAVVVFTFLFVGLLQNICHFLTLFWGSFTKQAKLLALSRHEFKALNLPFVHFH